MSDFAAVARAYDAFIQRAGDLPLAERMAEALAQLAGLCAAALALPDGYVEADAEPTPAATPANWKDFGDKDFYNELFDPYVNDELVGSSLSADLLEIHTDIARGLSFWDLGHHDHARWEWRFGFWSHWGRHAISATRALYCAIQN